MIYIRKPDESVINRFLKAQETKNFSYASVGGTFAVPPTGYQVDHTRVQLGNGQATFEAACESLRRWDQFRLGWCEALPVGLPIEEGQIVVVCANVVGLWWLNASRIIKVIDQDDPIRQFGFAYGTLPGHAARGEERFMIEWDHADNRVWFDILAFSQPNHFLTRVGYPLVRLTQKRFARESSAAMLRSVADQL